MERQLTLVNKFSTESSFYQPRLLHSYGQMLTEKFWFHDVITPELKHKILSSSSKSICNRHFYTGIGIVSNEESSIQNGLSLFYDFVCPNSFTQILNIQLIFIYTLLQVGQSSSNTRSLVDRFFKPWLSFPVTNKDFIDGIKHKCEKFYYKDLCLQQNMDEDLPYSKFLKSVRFFLCFMKIFTNFQKRKGGTKFAKVQFKNQK